MTVFLKSISRPSPSSSVPLSKTWKKSSSDVGVGLLDLVEQHDAVGLAADRLGQHAALAVADVAGGRALQRRDRVRLLVLRHVDRDQVALAAVEDVGQRQRRSRSCRRRWGRPAGRRRSAAAGRSGWRARCGSAGRSPPGRATGRSTRSSSFARAGSARSGSRRPASCRRGCRSSRRRPRRSSGSRRRPASAATRPGASAARRVMRVEVGLRALPARRGRIAWPLPSARPRPGDRGSSSSPRQLADRLRRARPPPGAFEPRQLGQLLGLRRCAAPHRADRSSWRRRWPARARGCRSRRSRWSISRRQSSTAGGDARSGRARRGRRRCRAG